MCLEGGWTHNFYSNAMNLAFEFTRPIEILTVRLDKQYFTLEYSNILKILLVVFLQINNFMIKKLIILMPFYHTYCLISTNK